MLGTSLEVVSYYVVGYDCLISLFLMSFTFLCRGRIMSTLNLCNVVIEFNVNYNPVGKNSRLNF